MLSNLQCLNLSLPIQNQQSKSLKKKRKKSAEMGYLIWVAAVGLSGAFLKFMQSTQFILAIAAD